MICKTIVDILVQRAICQSNEIAYTFLTFNGGEKLNLTYKQLYDRASIIAHMLHKRFELGDRVLLLYPPGLEFIEAFYGCLMAGMIAVPAYPPRKNHKLTRLESIILDCDAKIILSNESTSTQIKSNIENNELFHNLKILSSTNIVVGKEKDLDFKPQEDDIAFLQYTSGSTGDPKGVMVTHANLYNNSLMIQEAFSNTTETVMVSWLPIFHDMGLIGSIIQPLFVGYHVVLMSPTSFLQRPIRWLQAITEFKADLSGGPNFSYDLCVSSISEEQLSELDLSSWKLAYSGAEKIQHATFQNFIEKFGKCGFNKNTPYPCYGMAETTLMLTGNKRQKEYVNISLDAELMKYDQVVIANESSTQKLNYVSCGHVFGDHEIKIVNPHTKQECNKNEVGEIWAKGGSVTLGYWKNAELSNEVYNARIGKEKEIYLRTGDLGFIYEKELYLTGRLKDLIIIKGKNYYPQDLEKAIEKSHQAIQENSIAAFSIEQNDLAQLVIMLEVKRSVMNDLDNKAIVKCVIESLLIEFELAIDHIVLLRPLQLPKTSSGKIQRRLCRTKFLEDSIPYIYKYSNSKYQQDCKLEGNNSEKKLNFTLSS